MPRPGYWVMADALPNGHPPPIQGAKCVPHGTGLCGGPITPKNFCLVAGTIPEARRFLLGPWRGVNLPPIPNPAPRVPTPSSKARLRPGFLLPGLSGAALVAQFAPFARGYAGPSHERPGKGALIQIAEGKRDIGDRRISRGEQMPGA